MVVGARRAAHCYRAVFAVDSLGDRRGGYSHLQKIDLTMFRPRTVCGVSEVW